jgi:phosphate-selective porin
MSFKRNLLLTAVGVALTLSNLSAQETEQSATDTLSRDLNNLKAELNVAKKLKFSGWVQAQYQVADQKGVETYAGGSNFNPNVNNRFSVRRGRFKAVYDNGLSLYNIQIDISERGVQMREMFVKITDPWTKAFSLTTGMFNRPFGYEISQSSSVRETPERARMSQSLFFNERDMGTWLSIQAPATSRLHFLKIDAAIVSGTGITNVNNIGAVQGSGTKIDGTKNTNNNTSGGNDFDSFKDFIGRISAQKTSKSEKVSIGGGLSYYNGGYRMGDYNTTPGRNTQVFSDNGAKGFTVDSSASNNGAQAKRIHYGADVQLTVDFPWGMTTLRGEYIMGTMPGLGYRTYNSTPYSQPITPIYKRNFNGAYFYFVQRIANTKHSVVVKYDWYDPNTKVKGKEIGAAGSNTTAVDIRYDTWGFGYIYNWDANVKFSVYYDVVKNESTSLSNKGATSLNDYTQDIRDNVVTMRLQYKF